MKTNREILAELDGLVYGHQEAKKALIVAVQRSKQRHNQEFNLRVSSEDLIPVLNTLLIGQSGTGKTFLIESLAKIMDFPLYKVDATHLNPTGNSTGLNPKQLREDILKYANELVSDTKRPYFSVAGTIAQMVVFVDEVDKLANSFDSTGNWNAHVQASFLTMLEDKGTLQGITWVFAGAFSTLFNSKPLGRDIGFNASIETKETPKIDDVAIIKAGLLPEFVGRIGLISMLTEFKEEDYRIVLDTRIIPAMERNLSHLKVVFSDVERKDIATQAQKSNQGIRHLQRDVNAKYVEAEFEGTFEPKRIQHNDMFDMFVDGMTEDELANAFSPLTD